MIESSDLRMTRIPFSRRAGQMPALGFGTLIPDAALVERERKRFYTEGTEKKKQIHRFTQNDSCWECGAIFGMALVGVSASVGAGARGG
jgi:hypothetical protein